jgi:conjugal transfer ATP-binding protein TraC
MEALKAQRIMLNRQPLSELLPYLSYEEKSGLYILDHGIGFVLECSPLIFAEMETANTMRGLFESFFPPGTSIQFMIFGSRRIRYLLDAFVLYRENAHGDSLYSEMARKRRDFLLEGTERSLFKGFDLRVRDFRLYVSVVIPTVRTPGDYEKMMEKARGIKETVARTLNTALVNPVSLLPEHLISLLYEILNPNHSVDESLQYNDNIPIKDQIVFTDTEVSVERDHIVLDGKICKSFTVRQYPEQWDISRGLDFCGDMFQNVKQINAPFIITLNSEWPDVIRQTNLVRKKAMAASYQAYGPLGKFFPKLALKKEHFDAFMVSLEGKETPFFGYLNLFFFGDDANHAAEVTGAFQSLFRSLGFILQEDTYIMFPLFLQLLPMGYLSESQRDLRRRKTFTTSNVSELVPIHCEWKGMGLPILPLIGRRGQIQFFDIFSNTTGGYSGIVSAATGAGKSFFANELTISYLGVGARIWCIDIGRSYEKLCDFLGGDFIIFEKDSRVCLNPFSRVIDLNDEMPQLKSIVAQMASEKQTLDELSMAYIEEAIQEEFSKKGTAMTVTNVSEHLARSSASDGRAQELSKRLYPFTAKGAYAGFFEGEATLDPRQRYVVLELEGLKAKKDLQEVVLLSLIYQILQQIVRDRSEKKMVIIDEAWDLLTGGNTTSFMETGYRRFRKYQGSCISITQSINDFYRIPAGQAIIENADFMFLLRQRPESIEALKRSQRVSLSEGLYELLKSVHTDSGNYSEIFVYTPMGVTVGRLVLDRFTQLLYTTKPDEFAMVKEVMDREGLSIREAILKVIEKENMK